MGVAYVLGGIQSINNTCGTTEWGKQIRKEKKSITSFSSVKIDYSLITHIYKLGVISEYSDQSVIKAFCT